VSLVLDGFNNLPLLPASNTTEGYLMVPYMLETQAMLALPSNTCLGTKELQSPALSAPWAMGMVALSRVRSGVWLSLILGRVMRVVELQAFSHMKGNHRFYVQGGPSTVMHT